MQNGGGCVVRPRYVFNTSNSWVRVVVKSEVQNDIHLIPVIPPRSSRPLPAGFSDAVIQKEEQLSHDEVKNYNARINKQEIVPDLTLDIAGQWIGKGPRKKEYIGSISLRKDTVTGCITDIYETICVIFRGPVPKRIKETAPFEVGYDLIAKCRMCGGITITNSDSEKGVSVDISIGPMFSPSCSVFSMKYEKEIDPKTTAWVRGRYMAFLGVNGEDRELSGLELTSDGLYVSGSCVYQGIKSSIYGMVGKNPFTQYFVLQNSHEAIYFKGQYNTEERSLSGAWQVVDGTRGNFLFFREVPQDYEGD